MLRVIAVAFLLLSSGAIKADPEPTPAEDLPPFFPEILIHYEGHLWKPLILKHHPECPCQQMHQHMEEEIYLLPDSYPTRVAEIRP